MGIFLETKLVCCGAPGHPDLKCSWYANSGNESRAVVEFAPYQKIPPLEKKKMDNRNNTIEKGIVLVLMHIRPCTNRSPR